MLKDFRDKTIILAVMGAVLVGNIAIGIIIYAKLQSFTGHLTCNVTFGVMLSFMGWKIALACVAFGLISAIIIDKLVSCKPSVGKVISYPSKLCRIIVVGWVYSFIGSSALINGGLVGFIYPAIFLFYVDTVNNDRVKLSIVTIIGTAIGASLGAAVSAIFPNVMLSMWSAGLSVIAMGAIMLPVDIFIAELIVWPAIDKLAPLFTNSTVTDQQNKPDGLLDRVTLYDIPEEGRLRF